MYSLFEKICIIFFCFISTILAKYSCLDENGNAVDGWTSIKQESSWDYYVYGSSKFTKSKYNVNQVEDGMIMRTLQQLYKDADTSEVAYAMYNDEYPPNDVHASSSYAHAKGVIMTDGTQGFFIVHSMPNWPTIVTKGLNPFPNDDYAQSLQCITLTPETANTIAEGLKISRPYIYDASAGSKDLQAMMPDFTTWVQGDYGNADTAWNKDIKSVAGHTYTLFEKGKNWGKDLWDDLVGPHYKSAMYVETWRSGSGGRIGSICANETIPKSDSYDVWEVANIIMPDGETWTGTKDHSKWGAGKGSDFYCVGDLNRMCSQETRGGGALCRKDSYINTAFNSIVKDVESCWSYDPCTGTYDSCYWCAAPKK